MGYILTKESIQVFASELSQTAPRSRTGEQIEEVLAKIIPGAVQLPKDKKWFDIKVGNTGIECKTFLYPNITPGAFVDNVLKRVSLVSPKVRNKLRPPRDVGRDIINYLHHTIEEHAKGKGITGNKFLSVLARGVDGISFAYWEEPLKFGNPEEYRWYWNGKNTLTGDKNGAHVFSWYQNQKQLFYRWKIPPEALFFKASPFDKFIITRVEFNEKVKESYLEGYTAGVRGIKPKY